MTHRQAIGALIARSGLSRSQAAVSAGLPESSAHSAMHDYIEGTRTWPEGLLGRLIDVLRPGLLRSGLTEDAIEAEVDTIREGFSIELSQRLEARRGPVPVAP